MRAPSKLKNDPDKVHHQLFVSILLVLQTQMTMAFLGSAASAVVSIRRRKSRLGGVTVEEAARRPSLWCRARRGQSRGLCRFHHPSDLSIEYQRTSCGDRCLRRIGQYLLESIDLPRVESRSSSKERE